MQKGCYTNDVLVKTNIPSCGREQNQIKCDLQPKEERMFTKKWYFVLIMLAILVVTACKPTPAPQVEPTQAPVATPTPVQPKIATFIWTQEFDTLNPLYTDMWFVTILDSLWGGWAWEFDDNNVAFPKLVTEIPSVENGGISADGKTITIKLRKDIKWSDNTPITAKDFVFTWQMAKSPKNAVASAYPYDLISSIDTPDAQTLVMHFDEPFVPWQARLWRGILPSHILQPVFDQQGTIDNADWNMAPTVGCGPYVFNKWESGSFAHFVRNPNWWGEKPLIDEIYFRFVPDDASQKAAMLAGDGDLGTFPPPSDVPDLRAAGVTVKIQQSGYNEGIFLMINEEKSNPGMLDVNVRKAMVMAIDREGINRDLLLGLTKPPASYWDALPFYNNPPVENYPYDPEAAKKLLDEAGWVDSNNDGVREKDGVDLVIRYGTTIREIRQDAQAVIQQQLGAVGIKVILSSYDKDIFFSTYAEGGPVYTGQLEFQEWSDAPDFPDPNIYYWLCSEIPSDEYPVGTNSFFLCDEELDALIQLQATQLDPNERQKTISKINQLFHDKVYWIGLWQDADVWIIGKRLGNPKISGVTPFFDIVHWDLTQ